MKKLLFVSIVLMLFVVQAKAQKFLDVYQDGTVTTSIATSSIDSIGITGNNTSNRKVNFYRDGTIVNSYLTSSVDSIKVFRLEEEPLVYMGIVGFNQKVYVKPIDVLASSTSSKFTNYVNNLQYADGTLLYYAVDYAIDMLKTKVFDTPLTSVNLITFTDGLDQGSLMVNSNYSTDEEYLNALSNKINTTKVKGLPLTAYSIGLRGSDVTNYALFQNNLNKLASSPDKAFEASSMSAVSTRLNEISDQIISISNKQTISLKIPGQSNGTLIRFTFDGNSPEYSNLYIEGTFNLSNRSLNNVTYHGIKSTSGVFVQGTQDGIFVTFTFTGLQREDGNGLIPTSYIREYYKSAGASDWQQNSEFSPANNTQTTVTHSGAAIVLALDCSSSLGSQFSNMKSYARDFISRVAGNAAPYSVDAPKNVTAVIPDDNFIVRLSWNDVKHAEGYIVYRNDNPNSSFPKIAEGITSTTWVDPSPLSGYNYYRVYAYGHGLTSAASNTVSINYALAAPKNVKALVKESDYTIDISWDAVTHAESYDVYRSSSSSSGFTKVASGITATTWNDATPLAGNNYYRVYAVGHGLTSPASNTTTVINYALEAPQNVTAAIQEEDFTINVSWDVVTHAESYDVYRSSSSSSGFTKVASGITTTTWNDATPLAGNNYYRVYAVGHGLTSPASNTTTIVKYVLDEPQNVTASIQEDDFTIVVSWDAVSHAEGYDVYRSGSSSAGTFECVAEGIVTTNWKDVTPLPGNNYYRVYATGHGLKSIASNTTPVVKYVLQPPTNVTSSIPDDDFVIRLSWNAVKHAEYYTVYRSNTSSNGFVMVADGINSTTWDDESPFAGINYYQIYAVGHGLTSPASSTVYNNYTLDAPTNVAVAYDKNTKTITVSWNSVVHAECYDVYRNGVLLAENLTTNLYEDNSPQLFSFYYVRAKRGGIESEKSVSVSVNGDGAINVNGVEFNMIFVEGGTFQMGATSEQGSDAYDNEKPVHQVTLSDYYIGETEVTQELWQAVMGSNPSDFNTSNQLPVELVTWNDCQTFITRLNELTGKQFRLPTEAEWEYAARGGNLSQGYTYSGSNDINAVAWYRDNSDDMTHEVGTKAPNELGIYDMTGNVEEWCQDWYGSYSSDAQTNPTGPSSGSRRVYRGGFCWTPVWGCRVSYRFSCKPSDTYNYIGLRLAL